MLSTQHQKGDEKRSCYLLECRFAVRSSKTYSRQNKHCAGPIAAYIAASISSRITQPCPACQDAHEELQTRANRNHRHQDICCGLRKHVCALGSSQNICANDIDTLQPKMIVRVCQFSASESTLHKAAASVAAETGSTLKALRG